MENRGREWTENPTLACSLGGWGPATVFSGQVAACSFPAGSSTIFPLPRRLPVAPGHVQTQVKASIGSRTWGLAHALHLWLPRGRRKKEHGLAVGCRTQGWVNTTASQPHHAAKEGREMLRGLEKESIKTGATDKGEQASRSSWPVPTSSAARAGFTCHRTGGSPEPLFVVLGNCSSPGGRGEGAANGIGMQPKDLRQGLQPGSQ